MITATMISPTKLSNKCPMCRKEGTLTLPRGKAVEIFSTNSISPIMDYTPGEREFVMTGYCPDCQSLLFGSETKYTENWQPA